MILGSRWCSKLGRNDWTRSSPSRRNSPNRQRWRNTNCSSMKCSQSNKKNSSSSSPFTLSHHLTISQSGNLSFFTRTFSLTHFSFPISCVCSSFKDKKVMSRTVYTFSCMDVDLNSSCIFLRIRSTPQFLHLLFLFPPHLFEGFVLLPSNYSSGAETRGVGNAFTCVWVCVSMCAWNGMG